MIVEKHGLRVCVGVYRQPAFKWVAAVEPAAGVPSALKAQPPCDVSPVPSDASCADAQLMETALLS